jgi:hypothetical protein
MSCKSAYTVIVCDPINPVVNPIRLILVATLYARQYVSSLHSRADMFQEP